MFNFIIPFYGVLNASSTLLFISDHSNHVVRKIDLSTTQVTTLCGIPMKRERSDKFEDVHLFFYPSGLALDEKENLLYVADAASNIIKSVNLTNGKVTILAGNPGLARKKYGIEEEAMFDHPNGLALDSISKHLYVCDKLNNSIRKICLNKKKVETLCGKRRGGYKDGSLNEALFDAPHGIVWCSEAQELYVSDCWNHVIRVISLKNKTVRTLCGTPKGEGYENGTATQAKFHHPKGLGFDGHSRCLYVSDRNHVIRKISLLEEGKVSAFCGTPMQDGDEDGFFPSFNSPIGVVVDSHSHSIYVIDCGNDKIRKIIDKQQIHL